MTKALDHLRCGSGVAPVHTGQLDPNTVYIFTDGSCARVGSRWVGGWAAVLLYRNHSLEISGGEVDATVNKMELVAIHEGLMQVAPGTQAIHVYSDSEYAVNTIVSWAAKWERNGWTTQGGNRVQHVELIQAIRALREDRMRFAWVKGHSDHPYNDRADALATAARKEEQLKLMGAVALPGGGFIGNPLTCGNVMVGNDTKRIEDLKIVKDKTVMMLTREEARAVGYELIRRTAPEGRDAAVHAVDLYEPTRAEATDNANERARVEAEKRANTPPTPPPRTRFRTGAPKVPT